MYKIYCDKKLIHDDSLESLKVIDPIITQELNAVGSLKFTIYNNHPYVDRLVRLKSIIEVYQESRLIFKGRIINDIEGFYHDRQVTCESDLSFLLDSVQRPYDFNGTPADLFRQLINNHNSQVDANHQFKVGNITVTDPNEYIARSDTTYMNTWDSIKKKLIEGLGGYLWTRYESDGTYIDYLENFNWLSNQKIEFGKNLLDLKKTIKADDIFTVIVPTGAAIKDDKGSTIGRLTIEEVNGGKDYLEHAEAIAQYGRIVKMVEWKDVTIANNLKTKAQAYLNEHVLLSNTIDLSAADLGAMKKDINHFHLGTNIIVYSKEHNINDTFLVKKISIDLVNPAKNKISIGSDFLSMSSHQMNTVTRLENQFNSKIDESINDVINVTTTEYQSAISSSEQNIMMSVSENYYAKKDTEELIDSKMTTLQQTVEGWDFQWNTMIQNIQGNKDETDAEFENIKRYIRFIDGKIYLGEVGNSLELRIGNDRISFFQNNSEVAYFSNNKLFVTDGEYTNSLQLGKFAFLPRASGNLSFKKVRN